MGFGFNRYNPRKSPNGKRKDVYISWANSFSLLAKNTFHRVTIYGQQGIGRVVEEHASGAEISGALKGGLSPSMTPVGRFSFVRDTKNG